MHLDNKLYISIRGHMMQEESEDLKLIYWEFHQSLIPCSLCPLSIVLA